MSAKYFGLTKLFFTNQSSSTREQLAIMRQLNIDYRSLRHHFSFCLRHFRHSFSQIARLQLFAQHIESAYQFAVEIDLWKCRPIAVLFQSLANGIIAENVKCRIGGVDAVEQFHHFATESYKIFIDLCLTRKRRSESHLPHCGLSFDPFMNSMHGAVLMSRLRFSAIRAD